MRQFILPLGAVLTALSLVACSSEDTSSDERPPAPTPAPASQPNTPPQSSDGSKTTAPNQQTPVAQTPVQQGGSGYFEATNGSQRYLIPSNSLIAIQFPVEITSDPEKSINLPGAGELAVAEDKLPEVTVAVKDVQGAPVFAAGSKLIGTLRMNAPKAIFNVTGVKFGSTVYSMAANAEVTSTKLDRSNASFTNILLGALGGAGVAILIDGIGQDRSITWWAPLIGAAGGGVAAALLFKDTSSIVQIKANETAVLIPGPR